VIEAWEILGEELEIFIEIFEITVSYEQEINAISF